MPDIVRWYGEKFEKKVGDAAFKALRYGCFLLEANIVKNFTFNSSGNMVKRRKGKGRNRKGGLIRSKYHFASLPGEPPAVDTGALRISIATDIQREGMNMTGFVGPDEARLQAQTGIKEYGLWLELGTYKMSPRPYLRPALARCSQEITRTFEAMIGEVLK